MSDHVLRPRVRNNSDTKWNCAVPPYMLYSPWNSPRQNTRVGNCFLLQGIFPTQGLNPRLPHCRQILYQLNHQGSPRILQWLSNLSLLQRIFPTQESNWDLLHCRQILCQPSYQGIANHICCTNWNFFNCKKSMMKSLKLYTY